MANKDNPGVPQKQPLMTDPFVEQLTPAKSQATMQLTGWLGKGTEEGVWKLYLTPKLDEFVEFLEKDVAYSRPVPSESPLGGTNVWLNAGATLHHVRVITESKQSGFLSGSIASAYLPGSSAFYPDAPLQRSLGAQAVAATANWHIPMCQAPTTNCTHTKVYPCTLEPVSCGTQNAFCSTREFVC